jgi:nucleotide-binding universal stress UspA family protein
MPRKFKKILCPVDFSDHALTALDYATDIARQNDGQLLLLHVIDNPLADQYGPVGQNFYAEVEHALEKSKHMLAEAARTPPVYLARSLRNVATRMKRSLTARTPSRRM